MIELIVTNKEIEALKNYINYDYDAINQMLTSNCETDIALLSDELESKKVKISYDRESIIKNIETIKIVYELMLKNYYSKQTHDNWKFSRGTNIAEIERLRNELFIDKFISATKDDLKAETQFANKWDRPAVMHIIGDSNIPCILIDEILADETKNQEVVISPFTKIKEIKEKEEIEIENTSKVLRIYNVLLEKQELEELTESERKGLYNYIIENADYINSRLEKCIRLEKENILNYENIRKLEQLLSKYEASSDKSESRFDYSDNDNDSDTNTIDFDDIGRINKQLDELKYTASEIFTKRKEDINFITNWKKNLAVYLMAECRQLEISYIDISEELNEVENIEETEKIESVKEEKLEDFSIQDMSEVKIDIVEDEILPETTPETDKENKDITEVNNIDNDELEDLIISVKEECKENTSYIQKLLENIQNLILKQQNHAKIAGNLGSTYSALNNGFDMKKNAEVVKELINTITLKVEELCLSEKEVLLEEKLKDISKVNIQIGTLMNYLNNPKSALGNAKITRFDEIQIIEENELKRGILETIRDTMGQAELKKLKEDIEIIGDKGPLTHFFGIFNGKNKLDEFMLEQIEIRQRSIRKTLAKKLNLGHNYSIHEMAAVIRMFIEENNDDELVFDDVADLEQLEEELKRNFVISESKVRSIVEKKQGKNLPLSEKKISRKEFIEIETYRFLNRYGYDIENKQEMEPEYQDTMPKEILRIVEYINSSNVLIY